VPTGSLDRTTSVGPPQISLDSEVKLDAGDEPTSVEEDSLVDVTILPSFQMVSCRVALKDISELLRAVPSTQPRRRRTSESQEQPPELLRPKDAEIEVVLPTPLCQQPPPPPWLQVEVLPSFGEWETMPGRPCSPTSTHHGVLYHSGSIALHFGGDSAVAPGGSVLCADATIIG